MEIDGQFYFCEGCRKWQPFMGDDVTCDCGYSNDFTDEELADLKEAVDRENEDE